MGATSHPRRHHHAAGKEGMRACWFVLLPWIETKLLSPTQKSLRSSSTCERATAMNVIALQRDLEAQDADAPLRARGAWQRSHPQSSDFEVFDCLRESASPPASIARARARPSERACCVRKASTLRLKDARSPRRTCCPFFRIAIAPARAAISQAGGPRPRPP